MSSNVGEWSQGNVPDAWSSLFDENGPGTGIPLGTARWLSPDVAVQKFAYPGSLFSGRVWVGEAFDHQSRPLGYADDRHVCVVSGSRGGKGVGVIVPNLSFWPGSAIIVDPKGENATVSARRRGGGSAYAHSMGQKVCILDPFGEVDLPAPLKARYNPLDAIDPKSDLAIDDAGRVAAALIVIENRNDPYWEEAARNLIKGLILHVLSAMYLEKHCNLPTVRRLLTQGDWLSVERAREAGDDADMPSAFEVLWSRMRRNRAFNGVVAGVGEQMISMAEKQRSGVLESARTNTEFLDSTPMQRLLEKSDFDLGELKTNRGGLTVYLTLPARYMETHYRWLRLMITLAIGEMERIKGRPATGHPTLFVLDEFAGLKRMEVVEHAAAQAAGFGVKFLFIVQNLPQIAELYDKSWETFLGNSGLKMFFQIDDDFTRSYVSRQIGEFETVRQTRSGSESQSTSFSETTGYSSTQNDGGGTTRSPWFGIPKSRQRSWGHSTGQSSSTSQGRGGSTTEGWGEAVHKAGGQGLCVSCWHQFEVARTLALRISAIGMNLALDEMAHVSGLPRSMAGPRMQVPEIPQGPPIFNNIKVENSSVGAINTGTVQAIDVTLTYLHSGGNDKARDALKALIEAILSASALSADQKNELVDQVAYLAEQAAAPVRDRKPGVIKSTIVAVRSCAQGVADIASAWQSAESVLKGLFGL